MDSNGNLSIPERRALRKGVLVVYHTEGTAHRGEQRGRVSRVGESGVVWIGTTGSRYALACDYVRRADWAPVAQQPAEATPEPARRVEAGGTGKDTPETPDAPEGLETASVEALRAQVAALTAERDEARRKLKTMMMAAVALIETAKGLCGE